MVMEVKPAEVNVEALSLRAFLKAIEILGGLEKLAHYRTLTWLPSLGRAILAIIYKEEYNKTEEEIAQLLGLTKQTVKNMLRAKPEEALKKIEEMEKEGVSDEDRKELKTHLAGGIAKIAYEEIKNNRDSHVLAIEFLLRASEIYDIPWGYQVLKSLKGSDFPVNSHEELADKLKGISVHGVMIEEVLPKLDYPIRTPAELLKAIREKVSELKS